MMRRLAFCLEVLAALLALCACHDPESLRAEWAEAIRPVAAESLDRHDAYVSSDPDLPEPQRVLALEESSACRKAIAAGDPPALHRAWPRPRDRLLDYLGADPDLNRSEEHTSELPVTDVSRMPSSA